MPKRFHNLKFLLISLNTGILILLISIFYTINFHYTNAVIQSLQQSSMQNLSHALQNSLELAMLTEGKQDLAETLANISQDREIERIFILDNNSTIRFSSEMSMIGHRLPESNGTDVREDPNGIVTTLLSVNPIMNKLQCHGCHGSSRPVLGQLVVEVSPRLMQEHSASLKRIFIVIAMLTSLIIVFAINMILRRFVLNKLTAINETIDAITEGKRQDRIHMPGEDEFSALAGKFNFMIETINTLIRKSEDDRIFLQNLINSLDDGVLVVNLDGTVAMANKALLSDIGKSLDQVIGESCARVKGQQHIPCSIRGDECPMRKVVQEGQSVRKIQKIHSKTKGERYFEVFAYPMRNEQQQVVQMIEIIRNITDQKNMEAQLMQSEKLSEIGILAANVAHEINNPMASITTCADGLLKRLPAMNFADPAIQTYFTDYLQTIRRAAFRCKDYTRHLLMFATPTEFHIEPVDMQEVFNDILILLHTRMKKESKDITLQLQNEHVRIPADRAQLSQVMLNLLTNALDATSAGGRILVGAAVDGDAILIRVEDNGCGIDDATREKIFDPFFTTKERGKGTGLGLCIVKSIIEKHHGGIRVTSAAAQGAVFEIRLPLEQQ